MKLILHAPNVHQGGGRALLLALLNAVGVPPCTAILDKRLELPLLLPQGLTVVRVSPTFWGRLKAELTLRRLAMSGDRVLCFGNLPPLFKVDATAVSVYVQNRYLLSRRSTASMAWRMRMRLCVEQLWLRVSLRSSSVIVQTNSMASEVETALGVTAQVLPFLFSRNGTKDGKAETNFQFDFLYVASGEPHKNHRALVEAWEILAAEGIFPSLALTLEESIDGSLVRWIEGRASTCGLGVVNIGRISDSEIPLLFRSSKALIYPSLFESFGLPLLEAIEAETPIVAGELDYVRDVCSPTETFDPSSPVSIARAVKRFLGIPSRNLQPLSPVEFLDKLYLGH